MNKVFSADCVSYLEKLDPDEDIEFLRRCGWEPGNDFVEQFKLFTAFLKIGVSLGITTYHMGRIAAFKCNNLDFNLQNIMETVERNEEFLGM